MSDTPQAGADVASAAGPAQAPPRAWLAWLDTTAGLLAIGLVASSLLALVARWFWWADLLVHFRVQYVALALLLGVLAAWRRRRVWLAAAAIALLLNAPPVLRSWLLPPAHAVPAIAPAGDADARAWARVRIGAANLLWHNRSHDDALRWARGADADVLVFVEVDPHWYVALQALRTRYPYEYAESRPGWSGTLVLSRWPLRHVARLDTGSPRTQDSVLDVLMPRHPWRLIAVHATWPLGPAVSGWRAADLAAIAATARASTLPVVATGDFNLSPWSPHFEALLRAGTLRDAAAGRGWQPTWPTFLPPLGIQIDHVLVSPSVAVNSFGVGTIEGSDHRPVLADLLLP